MKLSGIEGSIYGFNLRRGAHSSRNYFQDRHHFSKWPQFIEVQTLQMIEITNFNYLSVNSYVFDNSKTEYWDCNFENPTWQPIVAIFQDGHHYFWRKKIIN